MAEIWGAAIVAGAGLVGSYMSSQNSSNAAQKAAQAQQNAADQSNATELQMYNQSRSDLAPWRNVGGEALNQLGALNGLGGANLSGLQPGQPGYNPNQTQGSGAPDYSAFMNSPDYQYALSQGTQDLDRSAAARGRLYSGGYGEDLTKFAQGLATQNLNNYENRLMGMSQQGAQAGEFGGEMAMQYANANGMNLMNGANAAANGYMNEAAANNGFINQLGQAVGYGVNAFDSPGVQAAGAQPLSPTYNYGGTAGDWSPGNVNPSWWGGA